MKYYQIYGLNVKSDFALSGAYEIEEPSEIQVTIEQGNIEKKYTEPMAVEYEMELGQGVAHYEENRVCLRVRGFATFMISAGNQICYHLYEGYDTIHVSELIMTYCFGILIYQRNMLMIHGSCIHYQGKALIISGESGAGKSSLADEMLARGYQLMADDIVATDQKVENIYAYPAFPMRKLCVDAVVRKGLDKNTLIPIPDPEREKYGILLNQEYYSQEALLGVMVIIKKGNVENPVLEEVVGADKLKYLTANFTRKELMNKVSKMNVLLMKAIKVANSMPIYVLTRPEDKITVKEQADLIEKNIVI